jgi:hypothetical protein
VVPNSLVASTGTGWAFASWTPTWTNLSVGNGTQTAKYVQIGKTVIAHVSLVLGSTSTVGTGPLFTLPVTAVSYTGGAEFSLSIAHFEHTGVSAAVGEVGIISTTQGQLLVFNAAGTYLAYTGITASVPFAWATSDQIYFQISYEAA